jgi:hypothetical protein
MAFNPSIFVLIGVISATIAIIVTTITLIAESRRPKTMLELYSDTLESRVRRLRSELQPEALVLTQSESTIHIATSSMSRQV